MYLLLRIISNTAIPVLKLRVYRSKDFFTIHKNIWIKLGTNPGPCAPQASAITLDSTVDSVLAMHPAAPGSILGIPEGNFFP